MFWNFIPVKKIYEMNVLQLKYFHSHGTLRQHNYATRLSQMEPLVMPKTSNRYFERTFEFIVPRLWNNLPLQLRIFVTKEEVKRNLKKWFKSNL